MELSNIHGSRYYMLSIFTSLNVMVLVTKLHKYMKDLRNSTFFIKSSRIDNDDKTETF